MLDYLLDVANALGNWRPTERPRVPGCPSPYSLAWGILALAVYRGVSHEAEKTLVCTSDELAVLEEKARGADDPCTVALCALALEAAEGDNVFEVRG
jgi:hypothetical protein